MSAGNRATEEQMFTLRLLDLSIAILRARSTARDLRERKIAKALTVAHQLVRARLEKLEPYGGK